MAIEQIPSRCCDTWIEIQPLSVVSADLYQWDWAHQASEMFMIELTIIARLMRSRKTNVQVTTVFYVEM